MPGEIIVFVTCAAEESEKLARTVVEERLAACVNIVGPVRSVYIWQDKVCNESEQLLVIKSVRSLWEKLKQRLKELHSYQVPEIVYFGLEDGYRPYLDWLNAAVG